MAKGKWWEQVKKDVVPNAGKYALSTVGSNGAALAFGQQRFLAGKKKYVATAAWLAGLGSALLNPEPYTNAFLSGAGSTASVFASAAWSGKPAMFGIDPAAVDLAGTKGLGEAKDGAYWERMAESVSDDVSESEETTGEVEYETEAEPTGNVEDEELSEIEVTNLLG